MKILAHEDDCEMVVGNVRVISEGSAALPKSLMAHSLSLMTICLQ